MNAEKSNKRRKFIKHCGMISFASLINGHQLLASACSNPGPDELIKEIQLFTGIELFELIQFYHHKLGFEILKQSDTECSFRTGSSLLTFRKTNESNAPFYHFAFNIPENKIKQAEQWQKSKAAFISPPPHLLDEAYQSANIVHFRHWDAHSLFFYDPAGNVVEYIARHTLNNPAEGGFTVNDVLYISEIGLVVDDVYSSSDSIAGPASLKQYQRASENFLALGDEKGLIIFFKEHTRAAFNKGKPRQTYGAEIAINKEIKHKNLQVANHPFNITSKSNN